MRKGTFTLLMILLVVTVFAQHTEYKLCLNGGLFSFSGKSAEESSLIIYDQPSKTGYTNNPYGIQWRFAYGISGNVARVTKKKLLYGVDAGYERLQSRISISAVTVYNDSSFNNDYAQGRTLLTLHFINLEPFIGYRMKVKPITIDVTGGVDLGYCLQANEKGMATTPDNASYTTNRNRKTINLDVRPRLQLSTAIKRTGVYLGYSPGATNYRAGFIGGTNECHSRMLRFGITYRVY